MADTPVVSYPFDDTGTAVTNRVTNESHTVTEVNAAPYRILIPVFAPFYLENFSLSYIDSLGVEHSLNETEDYGFTLPFLAASRSTGKFLYGGVEIYNERVNGTIRFNSYQTVGGVWNVDRNAVYNRLLESVYNHRTVYWDQVSGVYEIFPPTIHQQDAESFTGHEEILKALALISKAISEKQIPIPADFYQHITQDNAHNVSASTVGLGNVVNLRMATDQEVKDHVPVDAYVTLRQLALFFNQTP